MHACLITQPSKLKHSKSDAVVDTARSLIGSKYRYGGNSLRGFDCSGLTSFVFDKHQIALPRQSSDQYRFGRKISRMDARPGDLVFFTQRGRVNHVAIVGSVVRGDLTLIHSTSSRGVIEESLDGSAYWSKRYKGIRRPY